MKKTLALAMALMMAVGVFAGCSGGETPAQSEAPTSEADAPTADTSPEETALEEAAPEGESAAGLPKIGVVTPDADHGFTGESVAHARAELEAMAAAGQIEYKFGVGGEATKQISEIEAILQWGPDVIVLWPLEGDQLRNAATQIMEADVDLIIYDRLIDGFTPTAEVMGDNFAIGDMTGHYLLNYFAPELEAGETVNYLRFIGDSSTVSMQRSGGMDEVLAASEYADKFVQVQPDYQTDWSNATAQEQMENWLTTASDEDIANLRLIVTHDDEPVDGIVTALTNYNEQNPDKLQVRLITGVGARRETLDTFDNTVANGIDLVTYFFSPSMVRDAIRIGVAAATGGDYNGQPISGLILIPTIEVDKNTVADFRASQEYADRYSLNG